MSEAFTPLVVPEAIAAAHRIFERADRALTIRRALDGVPDRELISIVILALQLDAIAQASAAYLSRPADRDAWERLTELLLLSGHLPLPATPDAVQQEEPAHGEG